MEANGAETKQELHFFYDAQSRPAYVEYENMKYYYIYNFQGDVLALLDANNQFVVEYTYDIWGQPIRITGTLKDTIGKVNPFRYRSYPWDEETETYYLRNRLYLPKVARFIVSDRIPEYTGTETPFDRNQFSYCFNSPTDFIDPNGTFGFLVSMLVGGIVNAVVGAAVDLVCGKEFSWAKAGKNFVEGAFIGGAGSMIQGASYVAKAANTVLGAVATAEVSFLEYSSECAGEEREYSNAGLAVNMVYDTATSFMGPNSGFEVLDAVGDTVAGISTGVIKEGTVNPVVDKIVTPASKGTSSRVNKSTPRRDTMPYLKMVYDPLLGKNREVICYS